MTTAFHRELARDDLCRSAPFTLRAIGADSDGLTIEGYGAVFNSVTRIDSWEGSFEEVIAPGAFKKSLSERMPKMQFDHGQHPLLGSLPLGRWLVAEEDARGLHLIGRLSNNWLVQPFRDAIHDGGVEGMSFRFSVVQDDWFDRDGTRISDSELMSMLWEGGTDRGPIRRTLRELKASEAGPVVWPAYEDTAVGVRDRDSAGKGTVTIDLGKLTAGDPAPRGVLAKLVMLADRAAVRAKTSTEPSVDTPADDAGIATETSKIEPQPTGDTARTHPAGPGSTDKPAGEHSAPPRRPANPVERAQLIRREYRGVLDRLLDITKSSQDNSKEKSAS